MGRLSANSQFKRYTKYTIDLGAKLGICNVQTEIPQSFVGSKFLSSMGDHCIPKA